MDNAEGHGWRDRETGSYFPLTKEDFDWVLQLAEGAYGYIWLCKYKKTGQQVAMKRIDKEKAGKAKMLKSFKLERKALEVMSHPFILNFFSYFEDEKWQYIVLEYLPNGSLAQLALKREGKIPPKIIRYYICELILALEYLKKNRIVHRSIKPENILLDSNGHIRLTRFGSVKLYRQISTDYSRGGETKSISNAQAMGQATFCGEGSFVSPEVLLDKSSTVTYCTDLWSLGVTLYKLLTNTTPFTADSPFLLFQKIKKREINWNQNRLTPEAKDLIDKLIQLEPMKRLGAGKSGYKRLKSHPYFEGVKWKRILKKRVDNLPVKWKV